VRKILPPNREHLCNYSNTAVYSCKCLQILTKASCVNNPNNRWAEEHATDLFPVSIKTWHPELGDNTGGCWSVQYIDEPPFHVLTHQVRSHHVLMPRLSD
jgi:hypothetical protein